MISTALSSNGGDAAVARVRNVDSSGFDISIQEWEYLDGNHATESLGYIAVERGSHVLPDGTRIEAGRVKTNATASHERFGFNQGFNVKPVLFSAVSSNNDPGVVTTRLADIGKTGFSVRMQEQESSKQVHDEELISYIAWEPSSGAYDGIAFEIGRTGDVVNDDFYSIYFQSAYQETPRIPCAYAVDGWWKYRKRTLEKQGFSWCGSGRF